MITFCIQYTSPTGRTRSMTVEAKSRKLAVDEVVGVTLCDFGDIQSIEVVGVKP